MPQYNMASNVYKNIQLGLQNGLSSVSKMASAGSKMASIPMMATTGRPNLAQRTPIAPPPSNQQNSITQSMDWDYYNDVIEGMAYDMVPPPPPSYTQRTPTSTTTTS